jgi:hypothetical protein
MLEYRARNTDPDTSHEAAARASKGHNHLVIYETLLWWAPYPLCFNEISLITGIPLVSVSPSLKPMERLGWVRRAGKEERVNSNGGIARQIVWTVRTDADPVD